MIQNRMELNVLKDIFWSVHVIYHIYTSQNHYRKRETFMKIIQHIVPVYFHYSRHSFSGECTGLFGNDSLCIPLLSWITTRIFFYICSIPVESAGNCKE